MSDPGTDYVDFDDPEFQRLAREANAPQAYDQETPADLPATPEQPTPLDDRR